MQNETINTQSQQQQLSNIGTLANNAIGGDINSDSQTSNIEKNQNTYGMENEPLSSFLVLSSSPSSLIPDPSHTLTKSGGTRFSSQILKNVNPNSNDCSIQEMEPASKTFSQKSDAESQNLGPMMGPPTSTFFSATNLKLTSPTDSGIFSQGQSQGQSQNLSITNKSIPKKMKGGTAVDKTTNTRVILNSDDSNDDTGSYFQDLHSSQNAFFDVTNLRSSSETILDAKATELENTRQTAPVKAKSTKPLDCNPNTDSDSSLISISISTASSSSSGSSSSSSSTSSSHSFNLDPRTQLHSTNKTLGHSRTSTKSERNEIPTHVSRNEDSPAVPLSQDVNNNSSLEITTAKATAKATVKATTTATVTDSTKPSVTSTSNQSNGTADEHEYEPENHRIPSDFDSVVDIGNSPIKQSNSICQSISDVEEMEMFSNIAPQQKNEVVTNVSEFFKKNPGLENLSTESTSTFDGNNNNIIVDPMDLVIELSQAIIEVESSFPSDQNQEIQQPPKSELPPQYPQGQNQNQPSNGVESFVFPSFLNINNALLFKSHNRMPAYRNPLISIKGSSNSPRPTDDGSGDNDIIENSFDSQDINTNDQLSDTNVSNTKDLSAAATGNNENSNEEVLQLTSNQVLLTKKYGERRKSHKDRDHRHRHHSSRHNHRKNNNSNNNNKHGNSSSTRSGTPTNTRQVFVTEFGPWTAETLELFDWRPPKFSFSSSGSGSGPRSSSAPDKK